VADPSGTPLNVRSQPKPNGSILGALNNDTSVVVSRVLFDRRKGHVPSMADFIKANDIWNDLLTRGRPSHW
jgi:hypothetical protein